MLFSNNSHVKIDTGTNLEVLDGVRRLFLGALRDAPVASRYDEDLKHVCLVSRPPVTLPVRPTRRRELRTVRPTGLWYRSTGRTQHATTKQANTVGFCIDGNLSILVGSCY